MDDYKTNFVGDVAKSKIANTALENLPNDTFRKDNLESIRPDDEELVIQVRASEANRVTIFPSGEGAKNIHNAYAPKNAEEPHMNKKSSLVFKYKEITYELRLTPPPTK